MKEIERKILLQLLKDGRRPVVKISKRVGASRQTVAAKIRELQESGVIESYDVRLNPEKLGLGTLAFVFLRETTDEKLRKKEETTIKNIPQVFAFHRLFGEYSSILEVRTRDNKELTRLVKRIHRLKGISETKTFIVHSTLKDQPEEPFKKSLKSD